MSVDPMAFLVEQERDLSQFHVEFRLSAPEDFGATLDRWLGSSQWRETGHRFTLIGTDWSGGMFCFWHHPHLAGPRTARRLFGLGG
jgi:hypothetical protein